MIYKDKRHHPSRVFVVTKVQRVKRAKVVTNRIYGLELVSGTPQPVETSYLQKDFDKLYPIVMWAP